MNRVVFEPKNIRKFSLHCPFSNEKMDNEDNSYFKEGTPVVVDVAE